jgi:LPS-assembly protein
VKCLLLLLSVFFAGSALAASTFEIDALSEKHHVTADRTLYHSREKVYEAFGHVVVSSQGQRLSADYLWLDEATREIKARGNVLLVDKETTIQAAELHFNLNTGFGSIFYGKVSNDLYTLKGQLIRRVGENHFLTTEGEYTTCKDCAESWKLSAKNVDLTIDGYAFMDSVFIKVKDVPTIFFPYLVVPVKTKRQSGLLFPRIGVSPNNKGFIFVQPVYWAINKYQDATLGVGRYTEMGTRLEGEHRYRLGGGIQGQTNVFFTADRKFKDINTLRGFGGSSTRMAIIAKHELPLAENFNARLRVYEATDRDYPLDFPEDILGRQLPALESSGIVSAPFDAFFVSAEAKRYRNLLYDRPLGFDGGTVQAMPTVHAGLKPIRILGPVYANFYGRFDRYSRRNGSFTSVDGLLENGSPIFNTAANRGDLIRETNRSYLQPNLTAPFSIGGLIGVVPTLQFTNIHYDFNVPTAGGGSVANTATRYLEAKVELSTTLQKSYAINSEKWSKLQHQVSPFLTLSNIPWLQQGQGDHPFNGPGGQIERPYGLFDQYDRVPYSDTQDFIRQPEGKSIYYGFTSRLIRKKRAPEEMAPRAYPYDLVPAKAKTYPKPLNRKQELQTERDRLYDAFSPRYGDYQEIWNMSVSQAYDFKARGTGSDQASPFGYLLAKSSFNLDNVFSHDIEYRYFPRIAKQNFDATGGLSSTEYLRNKHFLSTSLTWYMSYFTNARQTRSFVRSMSAYFTVGSEPNPSRNVRTIVNWSFNDLVSARVDYAFDLRAKSQLDWSSSLVLTHPSECWGVLANYNWIKNRATRKGEVGLQLLLNLLGTGFLGNNQTNGTGPVAPGGVFGAR